MHKPTLILLRGLPGTGKTTLANTISDYVLSADDYFMVDGEYKFDPNKLKLAHRDCLNRTRVCLEVLRDEGLEFLAPVVVANTFTRKWEMDDYFKLAEDVGAYIFTVIVENRGGYSSIHGVPQEKIKQMEDRFEVVLHTEQAEPESEQA